MPACLAHIHFDLLAVHEQLPEIAQDEAPATAALVEVSLPGEEQRAGAADTIEAVLVGDGLSLGGAVVAAPPSITLECVNDTPNRIETVLYDADGNPTDDEALAVRA